MSSVSGLVTPAGRIEPRYLLSKGYIFSSDCDDSAPDVQDQSYRGVRVDHLLVDLVDVGFGLMASQNESTRRSYVGEAAYWD